MAFETLDDTLDLIDEEENVDVEPLEDTLENILERASEDIDLDDPYAAWGEAEESFVKKGGGGGGSKNKEKHRDPNSKTALAKKTENVGFSVERRKEEAQTNLRRVLSSFPSGMTAQEEDRQFETYVSWLNSHINQTELDVNTEKFRVDEFIPGMHAGGQGMQTSRSGRRAVHLPTYITGEMGKGGRSGIQKEQQAKLISLARVEEHLEDWRTYKQHKIGKSGNITTQDLYEVMI